MSGVEFLGDNDTGRIRCPACKYQVLHINDANTEYFCYGCGYSVDARKPLRHESKMTVASDVEDPDARIFTAEIKTNKRPRKRFKHNSKVDLESDSSAVAFEDIELEQSSPGITVVDVKDTSHYEQY